jgi:dTMP kinase
MGHNASMSKGIFISFEGIDGAGKSTHIQGLAEAFTQQGRTVTLTREPGGTQLAEALREMLLHQPMDAWSEALLVFAARRDHLVKVIAPALQRGEVVLCDRFTDATHAYQGGGRGLPSQSLDALEQGVQTLDGRGFLEPDLTLWFELPPEVAAQRLTGARLPDRFEAQPLAFFQAVHQGYEQRAQAAPQRIRRIDASASRHQVWQQITRLLVQKGWLSIMVPVPAALQIQSS